MKALSLWQPWATLIAIGAKTYETRSWSTDYRGPLLIHASKNTSELGLPFHDDRFFDALSAVGYFEGDKSLPLGCVVAICDLATVGPVELVRDTHAVNELAFGDYSDGRFAWKLVNVKPIEPPIPARGAQGLFDLDVIQSMTLPAGTFEQLRMF